MSDNHGQKSDHQTRECPTIIVKRVSIKSDNLETNQIVKEIVRILSNIELNIENNLVDQFSICIIKVVFNEMH